MSQENQPDNRETHNRIERYYNDYFSRRGRLHVKTGHQKAKGYYEKVLDILGVQAGGSLLDIACGTGNLLVEAEKRGLSCSGVDISGVAVAEARRRTKAVVHQCDVNRGLPFPDAQFSYITCLGSLEHFENQNRVLSEIKRLAKAPCKVCILVPNADYFLHKLGYETDDQPVVKRYSVGGWRHLLEINGFYVQTVIKDNSHLQNLTESSSFWKHLAKLLIHPLVNFIPLKLSYNSVFVCLPQNRR